MLPIRSWVLSNRRCLRSPAHRACSVQVIQRSFWSEIRTGPLPELQDPIYRSRRRYPLWLKQVAFTIAFLTLLSRYVKVEVTTAEVSFPRLEALVRSRSKQYDLENPEQCIEYFCIMVGAFFVEPKTSPGELDEFKRFIFGHLNVHPNQIRPFHVITMIACRKIDKIVQSRKQDPEGVLKSMILAVESLVEVGKLDHHEIRWGPMKLLASGNKNLINWTKKSKK